MKKRLLMVLFVLISIFIFSDEISARECKYIYNGQDIIINTSKTEDGDVNMTYNKEDLEKVYSGVSDFLEPSILKDDQHCWKTLTVCSIVKRNIPLFINSAFLLYLPTTSSVGLPLLGLNELTKDTYIGLFSSSLDTQTIDDAAANEFDPSSENFWTKWFWGTSYVSCEVANYNGEDISKENLVSSCDKFISMFGDVSRSYKEYLACGNYLDGASNKKNASVAVCKSKALSKVEEYTNIMTNTCNSILQNQSLSSGDGCVDSCLNSIERMKVLKEQYIKTNNYSDTCGFSENLIGWIDNILSIVKYILPILVIILGILDFIKAIASDKDDEMKKAQSRFVKRLISAALAFIIPFIIVFILEKFGFVAEGCGVINLK